MDQNYNFEPRGQRRIVYVKPVSVSELPSEIQEQLPETQTLYAVHDKDGDRLALVRDRNLAFALARQHDMYPVNVN